MTKRVASRYLAILFCVPALMLSGCGFHLRIQTITSPELKTLGLQSSNSEFYYVLESALESSGVKIEDAASYQVKVLEYSTTSAQQFQATANIANYTISATAKWTLETASGQPLLVPSVLTQSVSYQVNTDINVSNSSAVQADSELKQRMAMAIVQQVGAITTDQLNQWKLQVETKQSTPKKTSPSDSLKQQVEAKSAEHIHGTVDQK